MVADGATKVGANKGLPDASELVDSLGPTARVWRSRGSMVAEGATKGEATELVDPLGPAARVWRSQGSDVADGATGVEAAGGLLGASGPPTR